MYIFILAASGPGLLMIEDFTVGKIFSMMPDGCI
jgi:hypothetical protein